MRTVARSRSQSTSLAVGGEVPREVDRPEVAHGGLVVAAHLDDLGAQVGQVHDVARLGGLVARAVGGVLERHPPVAGLGERAHHPGPQVAGRHLAHDAALGLGGAVGRVELLAPQVDELGHLAGVDEAPRRVGLDPAEELVGQPVREVEVVRAAGVLAGVVAQLEELLDVGVPRLEVDARGALAAAALVDRGDRGVEGPQPRDDAVGAAVRAADEGAPPPHPGERDADAAGELRQPGHLLVALVDRVELVARGVDEVARAHLGVAGAGVEQGRAARQVGQARHEPVEVDGLARGAGQAARDAEQEVLRRLDDQARRGVAQEVAVDDGAQPEVLEAAVVRGVEGDVELDGVGGDEGCRVVADEALRVAERDRLAERGDAVAAHLLVDVAREEPGGQAGVLRLLADELGGRLDREPVELGGRRPVVEAADRAGGDAQRVDLGQAVADPVDGPDDLVDVDGLGVAVALAHAHGGPGRGCAAGGRRGVGDGSGGGGGGGGLVGRQGRGALGRRRHALSSRARSAPRPHEG